MTDDIEITDDPIPEGEDVGTDAVEDDPTVAHEAPEED